MGQLFIKEQVQFPFGEEFDYGWMAEEARQAFSQKWEDDASHSDIGWSDAIVITECYFFH